MSVAYAGKIGAMLRSGTYDRIIASRIRAAMPEGPKYAWKRYQGAERFLQGFTGLFSLRRRDLPDVETLQAHMPEGENTFTGPDERMHHLYRKGETYFILAPANSKEREKAHVRSKT